MSVQTLTTDELPDGAAEFGTAQPDTAPRALRILAVAAVCLGVAALAAATFVLSYSAIRAVALQAGITPRLARGYPLLLDAMLVIVLAAILALRGAGLPSRLLAWLTLLVVMTAAAGADALDAAGRSLPHRAAAITAAVLPFVLVLVAFALLVVMLRHARLRRAASSDDRLAARRSARAQGQPAEDQAQSGQHDWTTVPSHVVVQPVRPASLHLGRAVVSTSRDDVSEPPTEAAQPELAMDDDPAASDPSTDEADEAEVPGADEAVGEPADGSMPYPAESLAPPSVDGDAIDPEEAGYIAGGTDEGSPAPTAETADPDGPDDPDMPVFHRLFSSPTPPTEA
jgi:hypothetical protein